MKTRTPNQCRSHYQKMLLKYGDPKYAIKHYHSKLGVNNYMTRFQREISRFYGKVNGTTVKEESEIK